VAVAAVMEGKVRGDRVAILLTGSTIDPGRFRRLLAGAV
jgi:hypothetical protein